jgi:hypothetical protein
MESNVKRFGVLFKDDVEYIEPEDDDDEIVAKVPRKKVPVSAKIINQINFSVSKQSGMISFNEMIWKTTKMGKSMIKQIFSNSINFKLLIFYS